jgi:hypothetical protein
MSTSPRARSAALRALRFISVAILSSGAIAGSCDDNVSSAIPCATGFARASMTDMCQPLCATAPAANACPIGYTCDPTFGWACPDFVDSADPSRSARRRS